MMTDMETLNQGISCLKREMGDIEMERFISLIIRERFDYTKWRRTFFDGMDIDEINDAAVRFAEQEKQHA